MHYASIYVGHKAYEEAAEKHPEVVGGIDFYRTRFMVAGREYEDIVNVLNCKNV